MSKITAQEARIMKETSTKMVDAIMEEVYVQIKEAAQSGKSHIYLDEALCKFGHSASVLSKKRVHLPWKKDIFDSYEPSHIQQLLCENLMALGYYIRVVHRSTDPAYFSKIYIDDYDNENSIKVSW